MVTAAASVFLEQRSSTTRLMEDLSRIRGTTMAAVFDDRGVCTKLRRSPLICAFGAYRVLADVSAAAPGRSMVELVVDGRMVYARRLVDGRYAVVVCGAHADPYVTEVLLIEAAAAYALRASSSELTEDARPPSMTIPPPAGQSPSELPPIEASLVLRVGTLNTVYRDFERELGELAPLDGTDDLATSALAQNDGADDDDQATIAC